MGITRQLEPAGIELYVAADVARDEASPHTAEDAATDLAGNVETHRSGDHIAPHRPGLTDGDPSGAGQDVTSHRPPHLDAAGEHPDRSPDRPLDDKRAAHHHRVAVDRARHQHVAGDGGHHVPLTSPSIRTWLPTA